MKADFDIGNLVYVILTIAFLIVGAIGKKKKPVQRVVEDTQDNETDPESIKSQFQELFRDFNPEPEILKAQDYSYSSEESVEEGPSLDVIPEESYVSFIDTVPRYDQPIDSNINYNDQAQSSLDTTGMDEGTPAFDYEKDHSSLVYDEITKEYSVVLSDEEVELAGIVEGFNPKTAFVYSEIFNRKEF
jgi:hypothetical protein